MTEDREEIGKAFSLIYQSFGMVMIAKKPTDEGIYHIIAYLDEERYGDKFNCQDPWYFDGKMVENSPQIVEISRPE
jgi:hypothetical protein